MDAVDLTYPPIDSTPQLTPVKPPPGSPNDPAGAGRLPVEAAAAPATKAPGPAVAALAFVGERQRTVTLRWPFVLDGVTQTEVTIRRLTTQEISEVIGGGGSNVELYAAYARMTGLPADVLRGLDAEDGLEVTEICSGFLPQLLRTVFGFD